MASLISVYIYKLFHTEAVFFSTSPPQRDFVSSRVPNTAIYIYIYTWKCLSAVSSDINDVKKDIRTCRSTVSWSQTLDWLAALSALTMPWRKLRSVCFGWGWGKKKKGSQGMALRRSNWRMRQKNILPCQIECITVSYQVVIADTIRLFGEASCWLPWIPQLVPQTRPALC